jgi:hypothetical protein
MNSVYAGCERSITGRPAETWGVWPVRFSRDQNDFDAVQELHGMDRTEFFQALTLFLVALISLTTVDSANDVSETIVVFVSLPLLYLLPIYILVQLIRTARRESWITGRW